MATGEWILIAAVPVDRGHVFATVRTPPFCSPDLDPGCSLTPPVSPCGHVQTLHQMAFSPETTGPDAILETSPDGT